jgi:hypothetical protein
MISMVLSVVMDQIGNIDFVTGNKERLAGVGERLMKNPKSAA